MMRQVTLGRTKVPVSAVSLGTWAFGGANMSGKIPVGWSGQKDADSKNALIHAWKLNINHWDTADVYGEGKSEKLIGELWNTIPRQDIFLATKVGWDMGPYSHWYNPEHMKHKMERSLKNLKTDYVDVMYLHHCNFGNNDEYFDKALETIQQFQKDGKTRFIGLSDWSAKKIMRYVNKCNPDIVQTYRNIMDDNYKSSGLKNYIDKNNIGICFFSPIKHGLLTGKYKSPTTFEIGDHRSKIKQFIDKSIISKMEQNKNILEKKYSNEKNAVMYGVVNSLFYDTPTGCVILGQRNTEQVQIASYLGEIIPEKESEWIKSLYSL